MDKNNVTKICNVKQPLERKIINRENFTEPKDAIFVDATLISLFITEKLFFPLNNNTNW